ncbi:MAG: hypothetical protein COA47_09615 [Robiginitomaculum sp.]|nr:MAG: hypothetical protein COA47_09615 [Robiginitomaculum sp.]
MQNNYSFGKVGLLVTEMQDGHPVIVEVNDIELANSGFSREELIGKNPIDCFDSPETNQDVIIGAQRSVERGNSAHFVARLKKKNGSPYTIRCMVTGDYDDNGNVLKYRYISTLIDEDDLELSSFGRADITAHAERMTGNGAWRYSTLCKELLLSDNCHQIFGTDKTQDAKQQLLDLLPKSTMQTIDNAIRHCLKTAEGFSIEFEIILQSGQKLFGTIIGEAELDNLGKAYAVVGVVNDKTDQADLQSEHSMFLKASKLGVMRVDDKMEIVTLSPEAAKLLGEPETSLQISISDWRARVHPDDLKNACTQYEKGIKSENLLARQYRIRMANGTYKWVEIRSTPRSRKNGQPFIIYSTIMDVDDQVRTQRDLQISEQRFQDVLSQSKEAIFELDPDGNFIYISEMGPVLFGYSHEEMMQMSTQDLYGPGHPRVKNWAEQRAKINLMDTEQVMLRKDGTQIQVHINSRAVRDAAGNLTGYRGAARDITEQKAIRAELKTSEERFKEVISNANGCVFETDAEGHFTYLSDTALSLFGYRPEELIGQATYILSTPPPEGHKKWVEGLHAAGRFMAEEQNFVKKDGSTDHWFHVTGHAIRDQSREITGFRGAVFDVTSQKLSRIKMEESRQRLHEVVKAAHGGTFDLDEKGRFTFVSSNFESLLGPSRDKLKGKYTWALAEYLKPDHEIWLGLIRDSENGYTHQFKLKANATQEEMWLETHCIARLDEYGECFGYRGVAFDITQKKKAEWETFKAKEAAEQSAEERARFLSTMSHEIRTPLNAVIGMTDLLLDSQQTEQQNKLTQSANRAGRHLLNLVNDILDHSKLDAGKVILENTPFILAEEVENVLDILDGVATDKNIALTNQMDAQLHTSYSGDPARIRQILLNLIGNAIKFTEAGQVTLSAQPTTGKCIRFEVTDTGIGISEEAQSRLFKDFSQADASTTRKHGGTGLGLAISSRLVEIMGGSIGVNSEIGKGSTFWFEIPLDKAETIAPDTKQAPRAQPTPAGAFKVLVAEDNPANQLLMRTLLEKLDQDVTIVDNGLLALEAATSQSFDLIFMDMQMPVMDGYTAARQLRDAGVQTPIIALTAHIVSDEEHKFREAGMDDWLSKPFNVADLVKRLHYWGAQGRALYTDAGEAKTGT